MMWEKLKSVKLKKYQEHKPTPTILPMVLIILVLLFSTFAVFGIYSKFTQTSLPYCDYKDDYSKNCIPCPAGKYCANGKILSFDDDTTTDERGSSLIESIFLFLKQSVIALVGFSVLILVVYGANYRNEWNNTQIKVAESLYKELLYDLKESQNGMIKKNVFRRKFDKDHSSRERRFLESKFEEIRMIDEQVTYVNDEGELNFIFLNE